jgi:hypothetical protein
MPRHKYNAKRTIVDGILFDSRAEARRYGELKLLVRAKKIRDLEIKPRFPIAINGVKVCTYIADYRYKDDTGKVIVEDVKGAITAVYRLKKNLMRAVHGIEIYEVRA